MNDAVDYVRRVATEDVRKTLDWLLADGFTVTDASGGPDAGFGDVVLQLARGDQAVVIVRDRSQWMCDVSVRGEPRRRLDDALAEMGMDVPAPPREGPLLEQLPAGVRWRDTIPAVLESAR